MMFATGVWGIGDASFAYAYGTLCGLSVAALSLRRRRLLTAGDGDGPDGDEIDAYGLAILTGGPRLAITIAAAQLHRREALVLGAGASAIVAGRRPLASAGASGLEHAVYDAVQRNPGLGPRGLRGLRAELEASAPMRLISSSLVRRGLLLDDALRARIGLLWLWTLPVLALGVARVLSTGGREAAGTYLVLVAAVFACATLRFATQRPRTTARGRRLAERQRAARGPKSRVPLPDEVPWTVALYGPGALWVADPAIAAAWSVPRDRGPAPRAQAAPCGAGNLAGHGGGAPATPPSASAPTRVTLDVASGSCGSAQVARLRRVLRRPSTLSGSAGRNAA
jgi:uncharacterized protein (TIGR04222 family)